tara:strand:+ start:186 stop:1157 length:972 start_codon:yes stop_codon:yes gene_type:complete
MKKAINLLAILLLLQTTAHADDISVKEILITESNTYHKVKKTWQKIYSELTTSGTSARGAAYIAPVKGNGTTDALHKNGARNTIIFVPENTDFIKPVDVIFWFHGLGGFKERDFGTRVLRHTGSLDQENYIIIIPEMPWSRHTSTPRQRQGRVFHKKGQFSTFVSSVIRTMVSLFNPSPVVRNKCITHNVCDFKFGEAALIGHSAGGSTLMSISRTGGLDWLYKKAASIKIVFSDAGYGRWTDITWKYFKARHARNVNFVLLTRKWDRPYANTKRFLKKFRNMPFNIIHKVFERKEKTHAGIGDIAFTYTHILHDSGCGEGNK